eukprot:scaffold23891_cov132-Cylindrotheca_fusiformis.AAC.9
MTRPSFYLLQFALLCASSYAFVSTPALSVQNEPHHESRATVRRNLFLHSDALAAHPGILMTAATTLPDLDSEVEAEVLTDMAHFAMDFSVFIAPTESFYLSLAVFGRLLVLFTDCYVPGHGAPPEELAIQLFLLGCNLKDLTRAAFNESQK